MKKIFTLIALGVVALSSNAQEEKVLFENGGTYTDEQVLTSDNAQLQLGKDIKKATKWDNKATTSSEYLAPFTQSVDVDGEMKDRIVYIVGGNNPQDLEENGKKGASGYDGSTEKGRLPRSGTYYKFTPAVNGTALVGIILNAGKDFFVVDGTDAVEEDKIATIDDVPTNVGKSLNVVNSDAVLAPEALTFVSIDGTETTMTVSSKAGLQTADKFTGTVQFEAKANRTYYIFCSGSKLSCFGYVFTPSGDDPQPAEGEDILPNFTYTWNSSETFETQADGSVIFNALQWGGLAYWLGEADWSNYEKLVVEYAEPTAALTQIKIQGCVPEMEAQAPAGSTILEAPFEGFDMTKVSQVALQAAEDGTFHISRIYLVPKATTAIDAVKTTQNENAPIYNLAGQRVSASYKGVVIQNGRKFINK